MCDDKADAAAAAWAHDDAALHKDEDLSRMGLLCVRCPGPGLQVVPSTTHWVFCDMLSWQPTQEQLTVLPQLSLSAASARGRAWMLAYRARLPQQISTVWGRLQAIPATSLCSEGVHSAWVAEPMSSSGGTSIASNTSSSGSTSSLQPGRRFSCKHPGYTLKDVTFWAQLTGDTNPIHTDSKVAKAAGLTGCIVPGLLTASVFPAVIGASFPGAVYLSQDLKFRFAAHLKEPLLAEVVVKKISGSKVTFATACYRLSDSKVVVDGTAVALIKDQETRSPCVEQVPGLARLSPPSPAKMDKQLQHQQPQSGPAGVQPGQPSTPATFTNWLQSTSPQPAEQQQPSPPATPFSWHPLRMSLGFS